MTGKVVPYQIWLYQIWWRCASPFLRNLRKYLASSLSCINPLPPAGRGLTYLSAGAEGAGSDGLRQPAGAPRVRGYHRQQRQQQTATEPARQVRQTTVLNTDRRQLGQRPGEMEVMRTEKCCETSTYPFTTLMSTFRDVYK